MQSGVHERNTMLDEHQTNSRAGSFDDRSTRRNFRIGLSFTQEDLGASDPEAVLGPYDELHLTDSGSVEAVFAVDNELAASTVHNAATQSVDQMTSDAPDRYRTHSEPMIVPLRPKPIPARRIVVSQQFEGVVSSISDRLAWASLSDLTNVTNPMEVVEIPLSQFSDTDVPLLGSGSVFYWTIGRERTSAGRVRQVSELWVRRTPIWTESQLEEIRRRATELGKQFDGQSEEE